MRNSIRLLAGLIVASAAGFASAQRIGKPAPDISSPNYFGDEQHANLSNYRNRIVALVFFRTTDSASLDVIPALNKLNKNYGKNGLVIIGYTPEESQEAVDGVIKSKQIEFRVAYGGNLMDAYEAPGFPYAYLIDTNGILVWRGHPGTLEDHVKAQMRKTPPIGADPATLDRLLRESEKALDKQEVGRAYGLAKQVADFIGGESGSGGRAKSQMEKVEKAAREALDRAKELVKKEDFSAACKILADISVRMAGTEVAVDADTEIGRLRASGATKALITSAIENAKGEMHNDQAAELEQQKQFLEALDLYREVTDKYAGTDAAKAAQTAMDRINADPSVQAQIVKNRSEEEADRWLDLGDRFAKVRMTDMARKQYEKVLKEHPESRAASKAKDRLEKLPKES